MAPRPRRAGGGVLRVLLGGAGALLLALFVWRVTAFASAPAGAPAAAAAAAPRSAVEEELARRVEPLAPPAPPWFARGGGAEGGEEEEEEDNEPELEEPEDEEPHQQGDGEAGGMVERAPGAWASVVVSQLKRRQAGAFREHALTGFRNKASTDLAIIAKVIEASGTAAPCAAFDVGANIGKYVRELRGLFPAGSDCDVYAYEPNPGAYAELVSRVGAEPRTHAMLLGVAEKRGRLRLHFRGAQDTGGNFREVDEAVGSGSEPFSNSVVVGITTIDEELRRLPRDVPVPLIKVDVEGLELRVLQGMRRALERRHPQALYWERKGGVQGLVPLAEEVEWVAKHGYAVFVTGCLPTGKVKKFFKHNCRLTLVRLDGDYWSDAFEPSKYRDPGPRQRKPRGKKAVGDSGANATDDVLPPEPKVRADGREGGKFTTINLLAIRLDHPFMDVAAKTMLVTGDRRGY